jgi:hypothetical protein
LQILFSSVVSNGNIGGRDDSYRAIISFLSLVLLTHGSIG